MVRALDALREGRAVLLVGGEALGGDLVAAADRVQAGAVNFMAKEARGLIRLALTPDRCDELRLPMQAAADGRGHGFTVSIEARRGVSTGISAADRALTMRIAADPRVGPGDIVRPGHVFPVRTARAGVLDRDARPEAAIDLARLSGAAPAAVLCEVLDDNGAVAGPAALASFAQHHGLTIVDTAMVLERVEGAVRPIEAPSSHVLRGAAGAFSPVVYRSISSGVDHVALVMGTVAALEPNAVHVHRECIAGGLHTTVCSCDQRLRESLAAVEAAGAGVVIYLRAEDGTLDAHGPVGRRERALVARILEELGVQQRACQPEAA